MMMRPINLIELEPLTYAFHEHKTVLQKSIFFIYIQLSTILLEKIIVFGNLFDKCELILSALKADRMKLKLLLLMFFDIIHNNFNK